MYKNRLLLNLFALSCLINGVANAAVETAKPAGGKAAKASDTSKCQGKNSIVDQKSATVEQIKPKESIFELNKFLTPQNGISAAVSGATGATLGGIFGYVLGNRGKGDLNSQIANLKTTLTDRTKEITSLKTQVNNKNGEIDTVTKNKDEEIENKNKEIEKLKADITALKNASANADALLTEKNNLTEQLKTAQENMKAEQATNAELTTTINTKGKEIENLNNVLQEKDKQITALNNSLKSTGDDKAKEIVALNQAKKQLTNEKLELSTQINKLTNNNKLLDEKCKKLEDDVKTLTSTKEKDLQNLKDKNDGLNKKIIILEQEKNTANEKVKKCEEENKSLKQKLNTPNENDKYLEAALEILDLHSDEKDKVISDKEQLKKMFEISRNLVKKGKCFAGIDFVPLITGVVNYMNNTPKANPEAMNNLKNIIVELINFCNNNDKKNLAN